MKRELKVPKKEWDGKAGHTFGRRTNCVERHYIREQFSGSPRERRKKRSRGKIEI